MDWPTGAEPSLHLSIDAASGEAGFPIAAADGLGVAGAAVVGVCANACVAKVALTASIAKNFFILSLRCARNDVPACINAATLAPLTLPRKYIGDCADAGGAPSTGGAIAEQLPKGALLNCCATSPVAHPTSGMQSPSAYPCGRT